MADSKKSLIIIDGHSTIHRAFHAIKESLTNSRGEPTGAVYGFLNVFERMQKQLDFTNVAVVFDPPGPSFRSDLYAEYKANRPPAPEELKLQEKRIRQMLSLMAVPVVELPRFEADDVIASLAVHALEKGGEAIICSVDKDLLQIIRPGIQVWRDHLGKIEVMDEAAVVAKLGVRPEQVPIYLGLVGDTADNIPGVPGVGAKTAAALLQEYGDLESILAAAPSIKKKALSANLVEHADRARLSTKLATLDTDCVKDFDWDRFRWNFEASTDLHEFYREMEFQSKLVGQTAVPVAERITDYRTIYTEKELDEVLGLIRTAGRGAIDTETTGLDPFIDELVGIALSWANNSGAYIPLGHHGSKQLSRDVVRDKIAPMLTDSKIKWSAHNWGFDYKILKQAGYNPGYIHSDTMLAAYLLNPERSGTLRLKELAPLHLGIKMTEISELIGDGDLVTMASVTVEESSRYACQDADATFGLATVFEPRIHENGMDRLLHEVETPLASVLAEMEMEGVRIDSLYFKKLSVEAEKQMETLAKEIFQIAGRSFKINSPKQVGEILFDELKLDGQKKGKSGAYSTDVTVLESLADQHPLPAKLLEYRQVEKLKSTYIDPLPTMVHPRTGRIHSSFNQTIAATGRLSSSNPNLQNIPIRTEAGRGIRAGFIPRQNGWLLLAADYSQIELRILAHLSGDAALTEAFRSGEDVHTLTASKVFGIPLAQVTSEQRGQAKAINFGIIYGMSDFRLARDLGLRRDVAKKFIDDYFNVYSGVKNFIEETKEKARKDGFVTTLLGRRRFLPDINARNVQARNAAERIAVNTPIQGTSADMIKVAMLRVAEAIKAEKLEARMILQVHDELIFDCPEAEVAKLTELVRDKMSKALDLSIPIRVDVETGKNWAEA